MSGGFNGNGQFSFTYNWVNDAANGIAITASRMDGQFNDAVSGFDLCVTRDNQGKPSATFLPDTDAAYDIGSAAAHWVNLFLSGYAQVDQINPNTTNAGVGIKGVATNGAATAGNVGEYISATVAKSAVSLSTGVASDVGSISLPAGDWDVSANVVLTFGTTTAVTQQVAWISATSATLPSLPNSSFVETNASITAPGVAINESMTTGTTRLLLASTTTIYFSCQAAFTVSTLAAGGIIRARRMR